ncbi:MAG TPA: hypothetical protein VKB86_18830, partial [Pyrinomonadaceae bacterium]|nr:hypothetical protein [Pyrinomonadaceae bacterium]
LVNREGVVRAELAGHFQHGVEEILLERFEQSAPGERRSNEADVGREIGHVGGEPDTTMSHGES